ncbi:phosphoenolpyruvate mutase [Aneurinibacillus migulanus]|uniref:phosphoenolpyruvate mutase n=1 Tax=Aneurinibacillus migulanus TaxID=47500 RepID=A0A1G8KX50_ANEMI|nr:phosphoenolpyruvate mutase [Aneurinibacillus migulanus]SDI47959.1 phosphoenolpyruvate mutase [Aneurinibacillus migulanus]
MKKTTELHQLINSNQLEFMMEAHNGLSAKIVEQTGFKSIWASGLSISASLGVRDNNEATWTQVLDVIEFMSDATTVPILLDGDTGYGNFNNMRRLVKKLEQRGIAGVCIEDKLFPKTNSFINGEAQPLADIDEFCGKIKAAKDAQTDDDFVIVARVEAFIAGWGLEEALRRAEAYRQAGADAILMHSKKPNPSDIEAFMKEWGSRHPVIIVPTKYYSTPAEQFREWGVSMAIWANHNIRAAITAMEKVSQKIFEDESLMNVEGTVASVADIFTLQGADELKEAERKYLPTYKRHINAIILAASQGEKFGDLTSNIPKTLLKVNGKSILSTQIDDFNQLGIKDIVVVRGFGKEKINMANIKTVDNEKFQETTELYSLYLAKEYIDENTVINYGDIVFKRYVLNELLNDENPITLIVDADYEVDHHYHDYVKADMHYNKKLFNMSVQFEKMSTHLVDEEISGEFIGLWKVNKKGAKIVKETLEKLAEREDFLRLRMSDLFNEIAKMEPINIKYIKGSWLDIDSIYDLQVAGEMVVC